MNTTDEDVPRFLRIFTLLELDEVAGIVDQHQQRPELRYGQQRLASYATEMIFGKEAAQQAEKVSEVLFGGSTQPVEGGD